jgi:GT2 family glycosyltransferase
MTIKPPDQSSERNSVCLTGQLIVAVLVLYRCQPNESRSFLSLSSAIAADPILASNFAILLYDNSPDTKSTQMIMPSCRYIHDAQNGGLSAAYNAALRWAEELGSSWLLLLDQDTEIPKEYLAQLVSLTGSAGDGAKLPPDVAAIVPKLQAGECILSPHRSIVSETWRTPQAYSAETVGVPDETVTAFNSGALLRVNALQRIGGFPSEFWLDYLDHAVFHQLELVGQRVWIADAVLHHDFSLIAVDVRVSHFRFANWLNAERMFFQRYASPMQKLSRSVRLFRLFLSLLLKKRNTSMARMALQGAMLCKVKTDSNER